MPRARTNDSVMIEARPVLQKIPARMLIQSGWIVGTFHVPESMDFSEFLDNAGPFFKLTDVTIGHQNEPVEFFALRCDEVSLLIPQVDESKLHMEAPGQEAHTVACWLHSGEIIGQLSMEPSLRVSDYLMGHRGFVALRHCAGRDSHAVVNSSSVVFVNAHTVVGVVERTLD